MNDLYILYIYYIQYYIVNKSIYLSNRSIYLYYILVITKLMDYIYIW